ncbi:MAG: 1,4-alpha-glucan branching protein GlgB [Candidatus Eremiobacteraeota bacterium]|nr:1,4-alpha-glucan branching protein GlgB [Candidatus Eremiobacteraeota bacterium]
MATTANLDQIYSVIYADLRDPFTVLGGHEIKHDNKTIVSVRTYLPDIESAFIVDNDRNKEYEMEKVHPYGFYERIFLDRDKLFSYSIKTIDSEGATLVFRDPYSFLPVISEEDLYLYNEGNLHYAYNRLGAHTMNIGGVEGVLFAVWAPTARRVSVVGNFNNWDGRRHMMRLRGSSGIWEIFIPGLKEGLLYKYEIFSARRQVIMKMDPYAFCTELVPNTASYVYDIEKHKWHDGKWIEARKKKDYHNEPMSIYEVHLGSWMRIPEDDNRVLTYRELAHKLVEYVKEMGYTHIELLPIAEHPFGGSWGYQVSGYFSPTSRYGTPEDFMYFVDYCHQNDVGILLDWVPAHFPKDAHALAWYDGTGLYEHADPRKGEHQDWGTLIFNYGRNEVKNFLLANALFWIDKYHLDGLRIDAVASMLYLDYSRQPGQWIPNKYGGKENIEAIEFIRKLNEVIYSYYPGVTMIAEESTAWPQVSAPVYLGGLGFGFKWNMGWMNDMLSYMSKDSIFRKFHQNMLTFSILYAFSENFVLPLSHDEVVHGKGSLIGKMPGDVWQKFANLRLLYGYMFAHPGKKLLFMGSDFGQVREWNHDSSLDWHLLSYEPHEGLHTFMQDLLRLYRNEPSLYELDCHYTGFEWIDFNDAAHSIVSFVRKDKSQRKLLLFVFNFTPVPHRNYRIGVPSSGFWQEVFNSDSGRYWGSNIGNAGGLWAEPVPVHHREFSLNLRIPPLGMIVFKIELPEPEPEELPEKAAEETAEPKEAGEKASVPEGEGIDEPSRASLEKKAKKGKK